jgi:drug/metabolite transporter (DMT)-like permease
MAQQNTKNRLTKIIKFEIASSAWCLVVIAYIGMNINRLTSTISLTAAILSVILLGAVILLSVRFIRKTNDAIKIDRSFKETLLRFNLWKKSYHTTKLIESTLGLTILISLAPVAFRLNRNIDITDIPGMDLTAYILVGIVGTTILSALLFKYFYSKQINKINELLLDVRE